MKKPSKRTKTATINKSSNVAVAVADKKVEAKTKVKETDTQKIVRLHGAVNKNVKDLLDSNVANGTCLKNKNALAILWASFNGFNGMNTLQGLKVQHSMAPTLYYNYTTGEPVNDAMNGKHYCCSKFKPYYTKADPDKAHQKLISNLIINYTDTVEELVKVWAKELGKDYKFTGFKEHLEKIGK